MNRMNMGMELQGLRFFAKHRLIRGLQTGGNRVPLSVLKNSYLLQTIGEQLFWAARAFINLERVDALDLFSGSGLFMSHAYLPMCRSADLWDIDEFNAQHVRHWGTHVRGFCGDSVEAVNTGDSRLGKYNFILLDNPLGGPYGLKKYCEHFDVFPAIFRYFKRERGLLVLNYIPDIRALATDPRFSNPPEALAKQDERRRQFYASSSYAIRPAVAVAKYAREAIHEHFRVTDFSLVPRHPNFHFLLLFLEPIQP